MTDKIKPDVQEEHDRSADRGNGADADSGTTPAAAEDILAAAGRTASRPKQPLITAIEIENFKGIGAPVRIDLRPITLLFGRNSAGKSTILQALCYAHEILSHRNVDVHKTELGGEQIDLGGFRQFVHRHNSKSVVRIRFDLNLHGWYIPEALSDKLVSPLGDGVPDPDSWLFEGLPEGHRSGWVELEVRMESDRPVLSSYEVGVNETLLGCLRAQRGEKPVLEFNPGHPYLESMLRITQSQLYHRPDPHFGPGEQHEPVIPPPHPPKVLSDIATSMWLSGDGKDFPQVPVDGLSSALPNWGAILEPNERRWNDLIARVQERGLAMVGSSLPSHVHYSDPDFETFQATVTSLLVGIGQSLRDEFADFRYIGPVRNLHPHTASDSSCWADGSAAWARLQDDISSDLLADTSHWLSNPDRLDTGYALQGKSILRMSGDVPFVRMLRDYHQLRREFGNITGNVDLDKWIQRRAEELAEVGRREASDLCRNLSDVAKGRMRRLTVRDVLELLAKVTETPATARLARSLQMLDSGTLVDELEVMIRNSDKETAYLILGPLEEAQRDYQRVSKLVDKMENREFTAAEVGELAEAVTAEPVLREMELVVVKSGLRVRTSDIGVGISQVLPVVVAALDPDRPGITAIEQPELHVHPKMQVELGDLFAAALDRPVSGLGAGSDRPDQSAGIFLIETHSEHLILRLLRRIEETHSGELPEGKPALRPDQVSVVFLDQSDGEVTATPLRIDETGEFVDRWPQGFFEERSDELFY